MSEVGALCLGCSESFAEGLACSCCRLRGWNCSDVGVKGLLQGHVAELGV